MDDIYFVIGIILAIINGLTFFVYGLDKSMATGHSWRISEKTLWLLALCGGSVGALCGMHVFRHKTKKLSFQFVLTLIIAAQVGALIGAYYVFTTYSTSGASYTFGT